jgi:phage tail protein X
MTSYDTQTTYITKDGDMLDEICARHYDGDTTMIIPVLDANPHLADYEPQLFSGVRIVLPPPRKPTFQTVRLWD